MIKNKISFFIPDLNFGGSEKIFIEIGNFLAEKKNLEVEFVLNSKKIKKNHLLDNRISIKQFGGVSYSRYIFALIKYFNSGKPKIIFTSLYIIGFASIIAKIFSYYKPKIIFGAHNALSYKIKYPENKKDKFFLKILAKLFLKKTDKVIAVSTGVAKELIRDYHLSNKKVKVIYGPITKKSKILSLSKKNILYNFSKKNKYLICLGRLSPQKGYDVILKAFYYFKIKYNWKLVIIGNGSEEIKLKNLVRKYNLVSDVVFVNSTRNPYHFLSNAEIFLTASKWEGLSMAIIDALSVGIKVIATDCEYGPSEILRKGKYGFLAKVNSYKSLLQCLFKAAQIKDVNYINYKNKFRAKEIYNLNARKEYLDIVNSFLK